MFQRLILLLTALLGLSAAAPAAVMAGSITNVAQLTYKQNGAAQVVASNKTTLLLPNRNNTVKMPTTTMFIHVAAGFNYGDLYCVSSSPTVIHLAPITAAQLASMPEDDDVTDQNTGIVLIDSTGNKDPNVVETAVVHGHATTSSGTMSADLILTETGPNTGVFAGAISGTAPTSNAKACVPVFPPDTRFNVSFDEDEDSLPSSDSILIDPFGHVFDSATGLNVNGATITLIDDDTGQPAKVYGDDGVTPYPSTVISGENVTDDSGHFYDYGDGDYRFPYTAAGHYHLKIVAPSGYVAPSLVAPANMPNGPDQPYIISDASYGRDFILASAKPLEVDVPLDPIPHGILTLQKTASVREASPGDYLQYTLHATNPQTEMMRNAFITDTLPLGERYQSGSTRGVAEPSVSGDGQTLTFQIGDVAAGASEDITYAVSINPGAPVGQATNRAVAQVPGSPASKVASATVRITPLLFSDAMTIIGRVTEGDCTVPEAQRKGVANIRMLLEDGTYVTTDRDGLYHIEGVNRGRHVVQIDTNSLTPALEPVVCHPDTRSAGSALSRFVEGDGGNLERVDFELKRTGKAAIATENQSLAAIDDATAAGGKSDWLAGQTPGIDWLFPAVDHNPRAPAVRVALKHFPGQRIALKINGDMPDPLSFDGTDKAGNVAVSVWTGLPLKEGDNVIEARVLAADGTLVQTLTHTVHYANTPVHATYVPEQSQLMADGYTRPRIAVRLTDRDGKPVRNGVFAAYSVDAPYEAAQVGDMQQTRQLSGMDGAVPTAKVVGDDGLAFIELAPTSQSGEAHIVFNLKQDSVETKSEMRPVLKAAAQKWVVVGFGAGTLGYDTLSQKSQNYWFPHHHDTIRDAQVSLYAKGRIQGKWLLTLAYDSNKAYDPDRGLMSTIDPDKYYTVYGDGSRQAYDASSSRKLYLRLESDQASLLVGDYRTGLTTTTLTRYDRTLNGVKADYHGKFVTLTAFAAHSDQRYARDEIPGNGLSGPYRLSAGSLVPNSDQVTLETRDRYRSEKIIASQQMTRNIDYDINPDTGAITFKSPVMSRDADLNPIYIVVDYEVEGMGDARRVGGARGVVKLDHDKVEVGASYLRDESQGKAAVAGVDVKAQLTPTTELRAELAKGGLSGVGQDEAYSVVVEHHGKMSDLTAYANDQTAGFGLGQQNAGERGTRKAGVDGQVRLNDHFSVTTSIWRQDSLIDDEMRASGDVRLDYHRDGGMALFTELQTAVTTGLDASGALDPAAKQTSTLLSVGGSEAFLNKKLLLNGQVQLALSGDAAAADFPVRQQIGASYKFNDTVRLIASHEIADGASEKGSSTRIGFDLAPWKGAKLDTTLNQEAIGENGARTFAEFGMNQSLPIGKHWTIDGSFDASKTLHGQAATVTDAANPFAPASAGLLDTTPQGDYTAVTFGATYRATLWSWNGRLESRHSDTGNHWGVTSDWLRTLGEGKTMASSLRAYRDVDNTGKVATFATADIALAWRPLGSAWSLLERLQLHHEHADAGVATNNDLAVTALGTAAQVTTRLINNVALNFTGQHDDAGRGLELSLYYGAKYIAGKLADDAYDGFIDVTGIEARYTVTPQIDIGLNANIQHAWKTGEKAMSYGPSVGFTPGNNVWISVGYNIAGYHDPDNTTDHYTSQGPYVTMRVKFDQLGLGALAQNLRSRF